MKKNILLITLSGITLASLAGCQLKSNQEKTIRNSSQAKQETLNKDSQMSEGVSKEELAKMMPELADKTQNLLIDNGKKLHSKFDMKDKQILLISNESKVAYLINSQNEQFGKKDKPIEYAADTITDDKVLTAAFGETEFNGKKTYFYNVDMQKEMNIGKTETEKMNEIIKPLLHESVHLYLQPVLNNDGVTSFEKDGGVKRAITYPIKSDERIYRGQQAYFYREAVKSKTENERISNVKKGNYYYQKYLESNPENSKKMLLDRAEGQAAYIEAKGMAILSGKNTSAKEMNQEVVNQVLKDDRTNDEIIGMGMADMEYYTCGMLAYTTVQQLNQMKEIEVDDKNPTDYLIKKYGVEEVKENTNISNLIRSHYDEQNKKLKETIDKMDEKVKSQKYYKIKVSVPDSKEGFRLHTDSINYKYKNQDVTIEKVSQEIKLGDNRMKLTESELLKAEDKKSETYYLLIPKKEVEVTKDKLTIQSKNVQVFDAPFEQNGDDLILK